MKTIPYGYCHCGCGQKTTVPKHDHSVHGYKKGVPIKYIVGHSSRGHHNPKWNGGRRIRPDGYVYIWMPDHPRACKNYVMEHIVLAEKALGKPLPENAEVHHINGNRAENKGNLMICQDSAYHKLLHKRTRAFNVCGHANWLKCTFCKKYDDPNHMFTNAQGTSYHRECELSYQKKLRLKRKRVKV